MLNVHVEVSLYTSSVVLFQAYLAYIHVYICDPLWEKVHFRAKCNIEIRVKIAEYGPNGGYMDYATV